MADGFNGCLGVNFTIGEVDAFYYVSWIFCLRFKIKVVGGWFDSRKPIGSCVRI